MKKIYLKPTTKVVVLNHRQHLLAGSTPGISNNSYTGGAILAPGRNNYDDFDDFDEQNEC